MPASAGYFNIKRMPVQNKAKYKTLKNDAAVFNVYSVVFRVIVLNFFLFFRMA